MCMELVTVIDMRELRSMCCDGSNRGVTNVVSGDLSSL